MQPRRIQKVRTNRDFLQSQSVVKRRRKKIIRRLIVRTVLLIAFVISLISLTWLSQFSIEKVVVVGTSPEEASKIQSEVQDIIKQSYLGVVPKRNFLFYPRNNIKTDILKTHIEFGSVDVSTEHIHTLNIRVTERTPIALWCEEAVCLMMDKDASTYAENTDASSTLLHIYDSTSTSTPPVGMKVMDPDMFRDVISVVSELSALSLPVEGVYIEEDGQYVFKVVNNGKLIFSDKKPFEKSYQDLVSALKSPVFATSSTFQYIDVRFGNKVFYRLGKEVSGTLATTSTTTKAR